jgi:predicted nucleic acid-binding Zn ribbon protein
MCLRFKGTTFVTQMVTCAKCMTRLHKRVSVKVFDSGWYCNERRPSSDII